MTLPRLVVAAPATGQGKTTVSIGLMAALSRAGHVVSGHKVGPDYIDPGYHALACGRPGRNLDPHLVGEQRILPLLLHGAAGADVAVIEGVMGLYDGRVGGHGFASTAHVAAITRSPVILVVDISRSSRSIGAVVHGMGTFDDSIEIAGVILNKAGSPRHAAEVASSISLPVLGTIGRNDSFGVPSRHLGLVPAAERDEAAHTLDQLVLQISEVVDLDRVLQIAATAPDLDAVPWDPTAEVFAPASGRRPVVAMAGGRAFTFRYAETEELLRAAGCDVVPFDPLSDSALPQGTSGIYLGGGFPEVHAAALTDNAPLRADLRAAVDAGVPTVAECAGLLYLVDTLDGHPMVGAIDATAAMSSRLTLRYPTVVATSDSLLCRSGEQVNGHEFHRTKTEPVSGDAPAWTVDGQDVGFTSPTLHASYLHTHWAGHPRMAQRFANAVHSAVPHSAAGARRVERGAEAPAAVTDPLRHHGDVEAVDGLVDLAVNVFPGPPPTWLSTTLRESLERIGSYPDARTASAAAAALHGRAPDEALATAGAAEAFSLVAHLRPWRRAVVVHPQFTEPHAALQQAGHRVTEVICRPETAFVLDPAAVPDDADLVMVGNPTNPTGVLHPRETIRSLLRPSRLVVVDEAFMDTVPGEAESLAAHALPGLLVLRSLTKHWGIPGVRAGYLLGEPATVALLRQGQVPWSVSTSAAAAILACTAPAAKSDAEERTQRLVDWRQHLEDALRRLGVEHVPSSTSYVLARVGVGVHTRLREAGIAVRRADTFPGLGPEWVRIAARPRPQTDLMVAALSHALG
ncbi:cobyrinate a,c-diamide synthase [Nocardioides sp. InS609-2]|uniref:cobyrinate a,c-diamide synthase n=1 Tax=Nocardioides sp. InS609-2 TaxID=2760705 RepID=UPI0020BE1D25|nr:cobyrinate a,c-diamide synthase [Nocardioides sp. InS609-2]